MYIYYTFILNQNSSLNSISFSKKDRKKMIYFHNDKMTDRIRAKQTKETVIMEILSLSVNCFSFLFFVFFFCLS